MQPAANQNLDDRRGRSYPNVTMGAPTTWTGVRRMGREVVRGWRTISPSVFALRRFCLPHQREAGGRPMGAPTGSIGRGCGDGGAGSSGGVLSCRRTRKYPKKSAQGGATSKSAPLENPPAANKMGFLSERVLLGDGSPENGTTKNVPWGM